MKLFFLFVICFLLCSNSGYAQNQKTLIKYGDKSFSENDFYGASLYYKQALLVDSSNINLTYKYAESLRLYNEYELAEQHYASVYKIDKGKKFPECLFWQATMQKYNGNYLEAKKNFKKTDSKFKRDKNSYLYLKSIKEQESCDFAIQLMKKDSQPVSINNIRQPVNSIHSEFNAFQANDSSLYFSSLRTGSESSRTEIGETNYFLKIYQAKGDGNLWNEFSELDSIINTYGFHNANISFSSDRKRLYFSRCTDDLKCTIYVSELKNDTWQEPEKLNDNINAPGYTNTQPYVTAYNNDEILFFVSNRQGGAGKLDIWYSIISSGSYGTARPLGNNINSIDDEVSPFYDEETKTLYFSSAWHNGLGGFDIFKTEGTVEDFKVPENLGQPYNTSTNDFYFSIDSKQQTGFLTSNRKGSITAKGETCCNDIYSFKLPKEPEIIDSVPTVYSTLAELKKYLPLTLYFHNDEPNPKTTDTLTKKNYLQTYKEYIALKEQYKKEYAAGLKGVEAEDAQIDIESFFEDYVDKGVEDLKKFSALLLDALNQGFEIELTIKGYASTLAKSDYNVNLTKRRISSLKNYLDDYESGGFIPYINATNNNGTTLKYIDVPFGENKASQLVSDNLNDLKNSVYSRAAALERKIEIIAVSVKDSIQTTTDEKVKTEEAFPEILFEETSHYFGDIKYGEKVEHIFKFKNTGNSDLIIYNATGSCGCTVPQWSKEPIPPGGEAEIKVVFDSKGKLGKQNNSVTLFTNSTPDTKILSISGDVILKK